jgi:hypothetical protein
MMDGVPALDRFIFEYINKDTVMFNYESSNEGSHGRSVLSILLNGIINKLYSEIMRLYILYILSICFIGMFYACNTQKKYSIDSMMSSKIKFDLNQLDKDGLAGTEDGKHSISYEFCIRILK